MNARSGRRAEQVLYWVDINAPSLNRFDPATGRNIAMPMPESIGCFALRRSGGFVVALRGGIWLARADGTLDRKVADAPYDPAHHRFNDGRCDPPGRFFVGLDEREARRQFGGADRASIRTSASPRVLDDIMISNGLAWSPDGRTMYHADTPTHTIRAFDYDAATGMPSRPRVFAQWHGETDRPDGAAVDSAGNYWSAFYRGGKVVKISPRGDVLAEYPTPAMCPTMCAFGGADLRTLYVTSARQMREADELARLPQSGGIFALRRRHAGLARTRFAG